MQRTAWLLLICLSAVDLVLLYQRRELQAELASLRAKSAEAIARGSYSEEEERLLASIRSLPSAFPLTPTSRLDEDTFQVLLIAGRNSCGSALEAEIVRLNELIRRKPRKLRSVRGFFVDGSKESQAGRFIGQLHPQPEFPIDVSNVIANLPAATPPIVLVIRTRDRKIADAHKPVPEALIRRDAFYARLDALLNVPEPGQPSASTKRNDK